MKVGAGVSRGESLFDELCPGMPGIPVCSQFCITSVQSGFLGDKDVMAINISHDARVIQVSKALIDGKCMGVSDGE